MVSISSVKFFSVAANIYSFYFSSVSVLLVFISDRENIEKPHITWSILFLMFLFPFFLSFLSCFSSFCFWFNTLHGKITRCRRWRRRWCLLFFSFRTVHRLCWKTRTMNKCNKCASDLNRRRLKSQFSFILHSFRYIIFTLSNLLIFFFILLTYIISMLVLYVYV